VLTLQTHLETIVTEVSRVFAAEYVMNTSAHSKVSQSGTST